MNCNYKVKITDIQTKYKFKVFCTGYDDSEIKEKIDTMYEAWPKASGEGETPTLDNTANATMSIDLKGNTSQETTTGKNSIGTNYITGVTVNDATTNDITIRNNWASTIVSNENLLKVLKPSTTYTISYKYKVLERPSEFGSNNSVYILGLYDGGSGLTFFGETQKNTIALNTWDTITKTFTTPASLTNYKMIAYDFKDANNTTAGSIEVSELQIETGSTATTFEPYTNGASPNPDYPQDVHVVTGDNDIKVEGKNLFDSTKLNHLAFASVGSNNVLSQAVNYIGYAIPCNEGEVYSISRLATTNTRFRVMFSSETPAQNVDIFGGTGNVSTYDNALKIENIVVPSGAKYLNIYLSNASETLPPILLEKNSTATTYEPYQSQSYAVNLGTMELCKIGNYQDYIYKEGKKWYKYGTIGKAVLNGSENWNSGAFGTNSFTLSISNMKYSTSAEDTNILIKCSHFKGVAVKDRTTSGDNIIYAETSASIYIRNTSYTSLVDFKTMLGTNNITLYYVLATPTTTEITDTTLISQLNALVGAESYSGQTNISQTNDDKPFILTVKALKDLSNL